MNLVAEYETRAVHLIKEQTYVSELVSREFVAHFAWEEWGLRMRATIENFTAAQVLVDREISWPKTWWDAFKIRFFSKRLLARFPAELNCETLIAKALYPQIALPREPHVIITRIERKPTKQY